MKEKPLITEGVLALRRVRWLIAAYVVLVIFVVIVLVFAVTHERTISIPPHSQIHESYLKFKADCYGALADIVSAEPEAKNKIANMKQTCDSLQEPQ